jgi:hypothetical protein
VRRAALRSRGVSRESGQATVEWVALVLVAALVLTAAAALSSRDSDRGLGRLVAKRITQAPREVGRATAGIAPAPAGIEPATAGVAPAPGGVARSPSAAAPPASAPRAAAPPASAPQAPAHHPPPAVDAFRRLRGVAQVAKHAWIVCLGYRRWRYELAHPSAPTEALPLREALAIANECLNPYGYLVEE